MEIVNNQTEEIKDYKNSTPILKLITAKRVEKIFHFIIYIYLGLCALNSFRQIYYILFVTGLTNNAALLLYYLAIIVVTSIVFLRRKNLNWIILDLVIITILN